MLNSTPLAGWVTAYGLDASFLFGVLGGPVAKLGNFQINAKINGNSTAGSFAEGDTLTTAGSTGRDRVSFNIARYYATIAVDGLVEAKAAGDAYDQLVDIIMDEADSAIEDILDDMNSDLITSGSITDANGMVYQVATGSGLDANASKAVNVKLGDKARAEYYSSYIHNAETASLSYAMMDTTHRVLVDERKSNYDAVWTSETQLLAYEELLRNSGSAVRYVDAGTGTSADKRFKAIAYAGRPVVAIPGYDNSRMDFVRTRDFSYWFTPHVSTDALGRKITGIFKVEQLAKTTDSQTFTIITYGNLICKNPWKQAAIVALAT